MSCLLPSQKYNSEKRNPKHAYSFGIVFASFWDRFCVVLGSFCIVLGSFLHRFGIVFASFWDRFCIVYAYLTSINVKICYSIRKVNIMNEQFKIHLRLTLNIDLERKYKQKRTPEGISLQTCKWKRTPWRHITTDSKWKRTPGRHVTTDM